MPLASPQEALAALRAAFPVVRELPEGAWIVGGAVRDALLGRRPRELDVVVEGDATAAARVLQARAGGELTWHDRFGTGTVTGDGWTVDLATARRERYPVPGALPEVEPAGLDEDLRRRDFAAHAVALGLDGELRAVAHGLEDLAAGRLRVLHDASFSDDPTRLLRLVRYAARLGFAIEERTEALARGAFASGAPATAGPARMGNELTLLLAEDRAVDGLELLRDLGGLPPGVAAERGVLERARALVAGHGRVDLTLLAALAERLPPADLAACMAAMHVHRPGPALDAVRDPAGLSRRMRAAGRPSELHALLRRRTPEAVALAGAHGAEDAARRWLEDLRHVRAAVTGDDLVAAGVPPGPEIGRRLDAALRQRLDDPGATRQDQLAAALADDAGQ